MGPRLGELGVWIVKRFQIPQERWVNSVNQGTRTGVPWVVPPPSNSDHQDYYIFSRDPYKPSFATVTGRGDNPRCTPNVRVPMVFIVFNLGILGDEKTHKYPRAIGLILRDLP